MTATPTPTVAVIIVTWNGRHHLEPCLDALRVQTFPDFETVVVDNGSTDGTIETVRDNYPDVTLIRNTTNRGFAPANNQGIAATTSQYVVTLNNDTLPDPGWLAALVVRAEAQPALGAVSSKMVFAHDPATINSCGIALDPAGIAWDLWGGLPSTVADQSREVFGACAGAALYRRTMLDDVGWFDDDFFAYLEDVDLAWRAQLRGWRTIYEPGARVLHAHSGTLGEGSAFKRYLLARNKVWLVVKCAPPEHLRRWLPAILTYDIGATSLGVVRKRDGASVRGRLAGLRSLDGALAKRQVIQARRTVDFAEVEARIAPLAPPWDVPRRYHHLVDSGPISPGRRAVDVKIEVRGWLRARVLTAVGSLLPAPAARRRADMIAAINPLTPPPTARGSGPLLDARAIEAWPKIQESEPSEAHAKGRPPRVVVIRPDHLGDVLLSRSAIERLRQVLAPAELTLVVGPWGAPSLRGVAARVITFPFPAFTRGGAMPSAYPALLSFSARLAKEQFDAAVIMRPDHWWGAWAAALAGIPVRIGHETTHTAPFLTGMVPLSDVSRSADESAQLVVDHLLRSLRLPLGDGNRAGGIAPSARSQAEGATWLAQHVAPGRPVIAVHPGAGAEIKQWPGTRWATVVNALRDEATIFLCAGPDERSTVEEVQRSLFQRVPVAEGFTWDGLAGLYGQVDLVVGMDSGPLHLATAVGTPTVRVYGPTDPVVYGPARPTPAPSPLRGEGWGGGRLDRRGQHRPPAWVDKPAPSPEGVMEVGTLRRDILVRSDLACAPCGNLESPPCGHRTSPPCLALISPAEVLAAIRTLLRAGH